MSNQDNSNPNNIDIARAWKDKEYRNSLTPEQLAQLPPNPNQVGNEELNEKDLDNITGGFVGGWNRVKN